MNQKKIESIIAIAVEIENFRECYHGNELWGDRDGPVSVEKLIEFLIEHPYFAEMALKIEDLKRAM